MKTIVFSIAAVTLVCSSVAWGCIDSQDCDRGQRCVKGDCVNRQPQSDYQRGYQDGINKERQIRQYEDEESRRKTFYDVETGRVIRCNGGICN